MKLIVGLGNIGNEYERTYHNMGFLTINKFAEMNNFQFTKNKCDASVAEGNLNGQKIVLAKPTTYMNNSGKSVKQLMQKNGCSQKDLLVIVDDIDLPLGHIRFRQRGSSGTHNGMRSCVNEIGSEEFARLRIGIGKPDNSQDLGDFVLMKISDEKFEILSNAFLEAQKYINDFINEKL